MRLLDRSRLIRVLSVLCLDRRLLILFLAGVLGLHRLLLVLLLAGVLRLHGLLSSRGLCFLDMAGVAAHGVEREAALLATLEEVENGPGKGGNEEDPASC